MAPNADFSDEGSQLGSPSLDAHNAHEEVEDQEPLEKPIKSAMKKTAPPPPQQERPFLPPQSDPKTLDLSTLTPITPEIIARQATQNIGMWLSLLKRACAWSHTPSSDLFLFFSGPQTY